MTVVWETDTPHHALYVTDVCNSKCIMCPQIEGTSTHYDESIRILNLVDTRNVSNIGITGGEPTLNISKLVEVLENIAKKSGGKDKPISARVNGTTYTNFKKICEARGLTSNAALNMLISDFVLENKHILEQ